MSFGGERKVERPEGGLIAGGPGSNAGLGVGAIATHQLPDVARRFVTGRRSCLAARGSARRPVTYL